MDSRVCLRATSAKSYFSTLRRQMRSYVEMVKELIRLGLKKSKAVAYVAAAHGLDPQILLNDYNKEEKHG